MGDTEHAISRTSCRCMYIVLHYGRTSRDYLPIAKFRGESPRNFAEFHREISRSFSANLRGDSPRNLAKKTLGETSDFYFSPRFFYFRARSVPGQNAKQEPFS